MNRSTARMGKAVMIALVLIGCGVAATAEDIANKDPMIFVRGAQAWASNCARCHNMRDAKELRDDQWRAVVAHMRLRAGLTASEARDIERFLQESN